MTPHKSLLSLYICMTGKTTHTPHSHPDEYALVGYQMPRCDKFRWQGKGRGMKYLIRFLCFTLLSVIGYGLTMGQLVDRVYNIWLLLGIVFVTTGLIGMAISPTGNEQTHQEGVSL